MFELFLSFSKADYAMNTSTVLCNLFVSQKIITSFFYNIFLDPMLTTHPHVMNPTIKEVEPFSLYHVLEQHEFSQNDFILKINCYYYCAFGCLNYLCLQYLIAQKPSSFFELDCLIPPPPHPFEIEK